MDLIISHGHCPDGFCAALIAGRKYPEAEIMFRDHGLEPPYDAVKDKDVVVFDFSWRTREQNDKMASLAKSFHIFDHHKTAEAVLAGASYATFDMKRSGAGLAWDYLFGYECFNLDNFDKYENNQLPEIETPSPRPWYVDYVEDRDLWNWKLKDSRQICAYLGTLEFTKEAWSDLNQIQPETVSDLGRGALAHIDHYVREAVKQAQVGELLGRKTAVLNVPYLNCSEIGNELAKTHEVSLTWFERGDGMIQFSLRSESDVDVSEIAKTFNGGGHLHAAGFQLDVNAGRDLIDKILNRKYYDIYITGNAIIRTPGGCA